MHGSYKYLDFDRDSNSGLIVLAFFSVVGTSWTMPWYERVVYDYTYVEYYCPRSVYIFAFADIIIGWFFVLVIIIFGLIGRFSPGVHEAMCCIKSEGSTISDEVERYV